MTTELILAELENDPAQIGYAGLQPRAVHDLLSAPMRSHVAVLENWKITNFLATHDLMLKLMAARSTHPSQDIRNVCELTVNITQSQIPEIDLGNAKLQQLLGALVAGGVWSADERAQLLAFSTVTTSRAVELWGNEVSLEQVTRALWGDKLSEAEDELIRAQVRVNNLKAGIDNL